ncbi:MAG: class I SAM-dependent methyltransferase [Bdellovibrionales bacterium]|nr:class I SAM-dependent methyltransferase [Bdellovibrionales bacterium]
MMLSKAKSLLWYMGRPALWPQLGRAAGNLLFHGREPDTSSEALAWCGKHAVSTKDALSRILGEQPRETAEALHPEDFARARAIESACPVVMGGPGDLDLLYYFVKESGAMRAVETGVAYGWSSLTILLAMEGREGARLVSTDMPYVQASNDAFVGCVVHRPELRRMWRLIRLPDRDALPRALRDLETIDLCHYDSDKSYRGRMWAYPLLWSRLRPGGIFLTDDIQDNLAFRDFSHAVGAAPLVVRVSNERHTKYVGVLQR